MIKGKTATGFVFKIEDEARDDMEMLENLTAISKGDISVLPETLEMFLGKEQKKKLYDHCRGKSGRVSSKKVMDEIKNIFDEIGKADEELKN